MRGKASACVVCEVKEERGYYSVPEAGLVKITQHGDRETYLLTLLLLKACTSRRRLCFQTAL